MSDPQNMSDPPKITDPKSAGITAKNVTVTYRNGTTALRDASFEIPTGTITALVGVNGAGKSTLFKALMGFVPAAKGQISILGKPVKTALKLNIVAYVPQAEEVDWSFPVLVEDVVMMGRYGHMGFLRTPRAKDHAAVTHALERVNMTAFRDRQIGELSGGQRKRVFLARALAQDSDLYLMDEPFAGVDAATESAIVELLKDLRSKGKTVIVVHHDLQSAREYFDMLLLLNMRVVAFGPTAEVFTTELLQKTYGGRLTILSEMAEKAAREGIGKIHPKNEP